MSRIQTEWDALMDALSTNQSITELWCSYDGTEPYRAEKILVLMRELTKKMVFSPAAGFDVHFRTRTTNPL
jgi:hypothetical protein